MGRRPRGKMEKWMETKTMKLTKETLKQIIKEELNSIISEQSTGFVQATPMRGMLKYQPEMQEGGYGEPYVAESLEYNLEVSTGYLRGKLTGRISEIIAIISFQQAKESRDQEKMERQAENAKNVWSHELNMKEDPEKQEAFKQGLLTGSINFQVSQEMFQYRQSQRRR